MKIKLILGLIMSLALLVFASPVSVYAVPALPHAFYGDVEINGSPALDGTQISATVDVGTIVPVQNPVSTVGGKYGDPYLLVQGNIQNGAVITFHVANENGTATGGTYPFEVGGGPTPFSLKVTIAVPEPEPKPSAPLPPKIETTIFGVEGSFRISDEGEILETIVATSEDGNLTMIIEAGTIALLDGEPLKVLEAAVDPNPPEPPEGTYLMGAYDFGPDGATFDPPLIFTWTYDPEDIPEGATPDDLSIVYWDGSKWITLTGVVDTENHTVTAEVSHFTTFALVVPVPEPVLPEPEEPEEPTVEEPVVEEPEVEEPTVEEPEVEEPTVEEPEKPEVIEPEKPSYLWAYILAGVLAATGLFWLWWRRRRD